MDPIKRLIEIFAALLAVGMPPSISEEAAFRNWCGELAKALQLLADMTSAPQDDAACKLLAAVVADDEAWSAFYALIAGADGVQPAGQSAAVGALADKSGIDPATLLLLIELVM